MRAGQEVPHGPGVRVPVQQVTQRVLVPQGLGHLVAVHDQVGAVQPDLHEGLACAALRLGDLVLVVREDVVHTAAVYIERLSEIFCAHCRAFDVPTRPPFTYFGVPGGFTVFFLFPQREISHVVLLILIRLYPHTGPGTFQINTGEFPIRREFRDTEIAGRSVLY